MKVSYRRYQEQNSEKLRSLSKNDTKEFWNTLNNFSGRKKENADIPIETFYDYFKNLNEDMRDENDIVCNDMFENPVYDKILNGSITESEIIDAICNKKSKKW